MFLPGGALGIDLKGGHACGSEILDPRDSDCEDESVLDEQSLLNVDMEEVSNPHDTDVEMDDQSDCVIVAEVPADPECVVVRTSRAILVNPEVISESVCLEKTPQVKLENLPPPCKTDKSTPVTEREKRKEVGFQSPPYISLSVKSFPKSVPGIFKPPTHSPLCLPQ